MMHEFVTLGDIITISMLVFAILGVVVVWRKQPKPNGNGKDITTIKNTLDVLKTGQTEAKGDMKEIKKSMEGIHINCAQTVAKFSEQIKFLKDKVDKSK